MAHDPGMDTLLELDGLIIEQNGGYWTKFEVQKLLHPTKERPHGIRYSLSLHDRYGTRVMGFDNAHPVKPGKKYQASRKLCYDHHHRRANDKGIPYQFVDAHQLLKDFWEEVDKTLKKLGIEDV